MREFPRSNFVPRRAELLAIEGQYGDIVLSCRHKDILRCSETRHFDSCFTKFNKELGRPGMHHFQRALYCMNQDVCIIYRRDRAGNFSARCFGFFVKDNDNGETRLNLAKIYGNNLDYAYINGKIGHIIKCVPTHGDVYL